MVSKRSVLTEVLCTAGVFESKNSRTQQNELMNIGEEMTKFRRTHK